MRRLVIRSLFSRIDTRALKAATRLFAVLLLCAAASNAQCSLDGAGPQTVLPPGAFERSLHADMSFLAGDILNGRGPASRDEHIAALYAASRLAAMGLAPADENGTFLQKSPLSPEFQSRLKRFAHDGEPPARPETWNAVAILRGTTAADQVVLLSAHLDAYGIGAPAANGDRIYNGADDDASGVTAILALAQTLSAGPRPKRTILFALFGAEEIGGAGNAAFLAHPPVPLMSIVANLEFEMIGRPDPAVAPGTLWLTGFDRSTLGPQLACHGARLVPDPHPTENFFRRSDNFALARKGIIAQTVSSFGLHPDYHRPSDDLGSIDFNHLTRAVASMVPPIQWLANTAWTPSWNPGQKP